MALHAAELTLVIIASVLSWLRSGGLICSAYSFGHRVRYLDCERGPLLVRQAAAATALAAWVANIASTLVWYENFLISFITDLFVHLKSLSISTMSLNINVCLNKISSTF